MTKIRRIEITIETYETTLIRNGISGRCNECGCVVHCLTAAQTAAVLRTSLTGVHQLLISGEIHRALSGAADELICGRSLDVPADGAKFLSEENSK